MNFTFKSSNSRFLPQMKTYSLEYTQHILKKVGFNNKAIADITNAMLDVNMDYDRFKVDYISNIVKNLVISNKVALSISDRVLTWVDNTYVVLNSKSFIFDIRDLKKLNKVESFEKVDLDYCGDFYIEFCIGEKFIPIVIKFLKGDYTVSVKGTQSDVYICSMISIPQPEVLESCYTTMFFKNLSNKYMFDFNSVSTSEVERCERCPQRNIRNFRVLDNKVNTVNMPLQVCLVGNKRTQGCINCNREIIVDGEKFIITVNDIMNLVAHIVECYKNRGNLTRKNNPYRKKYESAKVHECSKNPKDKRILPLSYYSTSEYKKSEYKGGHHNSPIPHHRSEHYRRYYDSQGNVVHVTHVRGCDVNTNKGKDQTYRVNK